MQSNNYTSKDVKEALKKVVKKEKVALLQSFFKTGPGEYGEGDVFLGVMVPEQRKVARAFKDLDLSEVLKLLKTNIHEYRLTAIFILIFQYERGDNQIKKYIFDLYLSNTNFINNWDLIDLSSPKIIGSYLLDKPRDILYKLVKSGSLWERRIAVLATFYFIKNEQFDDSLLIAEMLLKDKQDLIHKAVGWMLREIGKKDELILTSFLDKHYRVMPRTMLRYSIEKFESKKRKYYMVK